MTINMGGNATPIEILLVEDSPGDIRLTQEALRDAKVQNTLHVVSDGMEATSFLWRQGKLFHYRLERMLGQSVKKQVQRKEPWS